MPNQKDFVSKINASYTFSGPTIELGSGILDGQVIPEAKVQIPLSTMNRHGLIAGATGTGKTKSIQVIAEQLSKNGVPVLLMDIKGDASGLSEPGVENDKIKQRQELLKIEWQPTKLPVEFYSLTGKNGLQMRATVSEFGPVLLSKVLELNDTQSSVIALVFKYCDDNQLPLLDLADLKKVLQYLTNEGKDEIKENYGAISPASTAIILRKVIELEAQDAEVLFGEPSFEVQDLVRTDTQGKGVVSILRLDDLQTKPKLFSTFMLSLLAEVYEKFPEAGDLPKPKLAIFIDEAHLVFDQASKTLLDQIETIMKLIRSKGIGVFWITQNPADIPAAVLSQLGLKIQHALRAFTANDNKAIKLAADNFPLSSFYDIPKTLTSMGIGEAFVTALNEKGIPTELVQTMMRAPETRMDIITPAELANTLSSSSLSMKYAQTVNRDSAYEILTQKLQNASQQTEHYTYWEQRTQTTTQRVPSKKEDPGFLEEMSKNTMVRQMGRAVATEVTRGILGILGVKRR